MYEIIWRLSADTLDTDDRVRPIFERIAASDVFEPAAYDLNQKQQWRAFDLERAVVDALTQRTQLVRIRGEEERTMAMIAMGKHGEEPTVVLRVPGDREVAELTADWPELFEAIGLRMALVTSPDFRDAVEEAGLQWNESRLPVAVACGWPAASAPEWLAEVEPEGPIAVERGDTCVALMLAPEGALEDEAHRRAVRDVVSGGPGNGE